MKRLAASSDKALCRTRTGDPFRRRAGLSGERRGGKGERAPQGCVEYAVSGTRAR
jgi:hypothetical protein